VNNQTRHGTDYIGSSCNDGDMEETLVKKNVSCGSGHTCVTLQTGTAKIWQEVPEILNGCRYASFSFNQLLFLFLKKKRHKGPIVAI
jgi:hypothetical protein